VTCHSVVSWKGVVSVEAAETRIVTVRVLTVPGSPPVNVRARPVSASTVVVQWEEPLQPNGVVKVCRLVRASYRSFSNTVINHYCYVLL